ncbi:hypothetical protein JDV02_001958 [Purpureocillium takamizusanense]|uniref:P-loop containing nucleoside triphosphate hydrolase protein n=1 Tax=Purpureocillium takamizusanense TaxID=2060973 RepID=A0A9Q8V778_9HYPO|nr:uncharacterized protein JDV02_001958 [Purpureocillium takamizusanense]UNI15423.1 hypothetical protein JDV02_001958 [Purpureocillium takamizusanense]
MSERSPPTRNMDCNEEFYDEIAPVIPRPKHMKVLVLGLPRTGTTSLCAALKVLGMNPYHFSEISRNKNNKHFQLWLKAVQAKYDGVGVPLKGGDFDHILWNYDAVTDDPCCLFVDELIATYPEAKVILTVRPREEWLRSMQQTILKILSWRSWPILCLLDHEFMGPYQALLNRTTSVLSQGHLPYTPSAYPALLDSFDKHNDNVRNAVPNERLLEFHPSQGWDALCNFLDMPIPEGKYPHLNYANDLMRLEHSLYWARWYWVAQRMAKRAGIVILVLLAALYLDRI